MSPTVRIFDPPKREAAAGEGCAIVSHDETVSSSGHNNGVTELMNGTRAGHCVRIDDSGEAIKGRNHGRIGDEPVGHESRSTTSVMSPTISRSG